MINIRSGLLRKHSLLLAVIFRLIDAMIIAGTLMWCTFRFGISWDADFTVLAVVAVGTFTYYANKFELYLSWRTASIWSECKKTVKAWFLVAIVSLAVGFLVNINKDMLRVIIGGWFLSCFIALPLWRSCLRTALHYIRKKGRNKKYLAIAGAGELGLRIASSIIHNPWTGIELVGIFDNSFTKESIIDPELGVVFSGNLDDLVEKAHTGAFDYVYIAMSASDEEQIMDLNNRLAEAVTQIFIVPDLFMLDLMNANQVQLARIPAVNISENPLHSATNWITRFPHAVKRTFDVLFSLTVLTVLSPLLLLIALLIRILEGAPVTYRSIRYISLNKKIYSLKFRTMVRDATDPKYRLKERYMRDGFLDIPISCEVYTPIGRLLEKTQLVEILQLFNILVDGMSLIGNRPLPFDNLCLLKKHPDWSKRFESPAGITGITQVVGKLNLSPVQRLELEGLYSDVYRRGNILLCDVMIVLYTLRLIILRKDTPIEKAYELLRRCL